EHEDVFTVIADLAQARVAEEAVNAVVHHFGGLDILVNCAGISDGAPAHETTDAAWERMININLSAAFRTSRAAVRHLARSAGCIVNVTSTMGLLGYSGQAAYAASKAGLIGLTRQMAADYGPDGVRVNAVAPGVTKTPMTMSRFDSDPEWVSSVVDPVP